MTRSVGNIEIRNKEPFVPIDGRFDGKKLKCSAMSQRGEVLYEKEAETPLDISYGPFINCSQQNSNKTTQDFEITCFITKNPHPTAGTITMRRPSGEMVVNGAQGISWRTVDVRVSLPVIYTFYAQVFPNFAISCERSNTKPEVKQTTRPYPANQDKKMAVVVTIARDQLKRAAALTLTFSAGPPVRRGIEVKEYISFSYVEAQMEPNVGLIAGVSVGKEDGKPRCRAIIDYCILITLFC